MPWMRAGAIAASGGYVETANYPLELVSPREAGTFPSGDAGTPAFPAEHFSLRPTTGVPYRYFAVAMFGSFPYTWSISGEPSGMTIDSATGEINWPVPTGSSASFTITVTDSAGTAVSSTPVLTISLDDKFFVAASGGSDSNSGVQASPWLTLDHARDAAGADAIVYMRTGSYDYAGIPRSQDAPVTSTVDTTAFTPTVDTFEVVSTTDLTDHIVLFSDGPAAGKASYVEDWTLVGGRGHIVLREELPAPPASGNNFRSNRNWTRVVFSASADQPIKFAAYPDEVVTFDNGYVSPTGDWGPIARFSPNSDHTYYFGGIHFTNAFHLAVQLDFGNHYGNIQDCTVSDVQHVVDGANSAGFMYLTADTLPSLYSTIQDLTTSNMGPGAFKIYSLHKHLTERCDLTDCGLGPDWKAYAVQFELRTTEFTEMTEANHTAGFQGNMAFGSDDDQRSTGEIRYCYMDGVANDWACRISPDVQAGNIFFYRNTVRGNFEVAEWSSISGVMSAYHNVIVNANSGSTDRITQNSVSDATKVVLTDNVSGANDGSIIDSSGNLTGSSLTNYGPTTSTPRGRQYA